MSNGPGKRFTGPFRLVDVEAEERVSGAVPAGATADDQQPFELLLSPFQRRLLTGLREVEKGQEALFRGQSDLTVAFGAQKAAFDALVPRVVRLERNAKWKVWAVRAAKAAVPLAAAVLGRYAPDLAKHLPDLLEFFAKLAVESPVL